MSRGLILRNLAALVVIFGAVAGIDVLIGDLSWLEVAVWALILFVVPSLIERYFRRRNRAPADT